MTEPKAFGQQIRERDIEKAFLTGPGEFLVKKTLSQLGSVKPFAALFGAYRVVTKAGQAVADLDPVEEQGRWADYAKSDWSIRQLPVINVYEAEVEDKQSSNAYLNGTVQIQVFWPPNFRRSDLSRIPMAFRGALLNFFESRWVTDMLDELFSVVRPMKVPGLNEYGKVITWAPNVEGLLENQMVPVTMVSIKYRIDLRSWYRAMEFDDRTKADPFERTLDDLKQIGGEYDGVPETDPADVQIKVQDEVIINP